MALNEYDELLTTGQTPAANEYDALLADERDLQKTALRQSLNAATATPPDTAARALEYAERLNLPRGTVERNLEVIERRDAVERNDYDKLLDELPVLSAWLTESPDNAAVAQDDLDQLGTLEALTSALATGYRHGRHTTELGRLGYQLAAGDRDPSTLRRLEALERDLAAAPGGHGFSAQWVYPAAKYIGQMLESGAKGLETGFAGASAGAAAAAIAGQLGPQVAAPEEVVTVPAAAALGFSAGIKSGFIADAYTVEAGHAYLELSRARGAAGEQIDETTKRSAAVGVGLINAALEYLGIKLVVAPWKTAAKKFVSDGTRDALVTPTVRRAVANFGAAYATAIAGEVTTEVLQESTNVLAEELAKFVTEGEFATLANSPEQRDATIERLFDVASETFRGMALIGLPGATVNLTADVRNVARARENQNFFTALGQTAEASKLRERLPGKLQEFVARATADGPVENVYIPVEAFATYFQGAAVDARTVATELLGDANAYDAALRTGEDLKIPTAVYAAKLAGTAHHKALAPDLKLSPEEMTAREAEAFVESLKQQAATPDEVSDTGAGQSVRDDVLGQLLGTGYERATAEAYAELYESTFRTLGKRAGVDPFALYQRYGLKVERPLPEVLRKLGSTDAVDVLIDRLRKGDIPSDRDVHGPSLLDFLVEQGGLQDQGGELSARDAAKARRGLVRDTGRTLDDAAEIAVEAGYLAERDPNLLLEAIGSELRGQRVNAAERGNPEAQNVRAALEQLDEYLRQVGVDIKTADNPAIKQLLRAETETPAAREFEQGDKIVPVTPKRGPGTDLTQQTPPKPEVEVYFDDTSGDWSYRIDGKESDYTYDTEKEARADAIRQLFPPLQVDVERANATTIYRAHEAQESNNIRAFTSWSPDRSTAEAYTNNPGFGGAFVRTAAVDLSNVLDVDPHSIAGYRRLAEVLEYENPAETAEDWWSIGRRYVWEERGEIKQRLARSGYDWIRYEDDFPDGAITLVPLHDIEIKEQSPEPPGAQPGAPTQLEQRTPDANRGAIRIGPEREISIRLLERADLSTFLHETGHFYLEVLGDLATGELATGKPAPADLVRDYQAILDWLGVKSRDEIKVEHHEQFARGFEAYLREGKAPSAGLRAAFAKFRAWLVAIYRSIARLDVKLTDEVRGVMDRLLATEEEIAAAQAEGEVVALFNDAAAAGMTDAEFAAYRQTVETANVAARERLQTSLLAQVKREQSAAYQAERGKMRETVGREVDQQPGYRAAALLAKGTLPDGSPLPEGARAFKLDRKVIVVAYGKDFAAKLRAYTAAPDDATPTFAPDQAAEALGYSTGEDLLMALANLRPREALIDAEADVRLREQHGDLMLDGTKLAAEAQRSLHGDERAKVIAAELAALRRQQRQVRPFVRAEQQKQAAERRAGVSLMRGSTLPIAQIRAMAEGMIAQRRVREIQPGTYLVAMRRAARQAVEAAGKGEYAVAAAAKQRELLNLELYRAARDALDDTDTIADYLGKFTKDKARAKLGKAGADYLEQVDGLLERFEFKRVTGRNLDRRAALAQWITDKQTAGDTAGEEFVVPDRLLDEAYRVNYRQLTVEELRGLRDAVKQIAHFARLKNKLLAGAKDQERDAAKAELLAAIEANLTDRGPPPLTKAALSRIEKLGRGVATFDASLLKMEQLVDWLDGDDLNGPWHRYLWDGAAAAQAAELDYSKRITAKIAHAVMNIPKPIRARMLERVAIPGIDRAVTRKDLIGVALNVGNQSNYDKLLKGMGWTPEQVQDMVDRLTPDEIGFVNSVHATLESMWPDIAKLQKELTGLEPDKVEARAFPAKGGTITGGYYPIMYDPLASQQGQLQLASRVGGLLEDSYTRATTPKGHTKARVTGFAAPFNLDIDDLTGHIAGVVKDLTHRKWLLDANWLVHDREIRAALRRHLGDAYVGLFPDWVRAVVNDRNFGSMRSLNIWRRGVEHLRYNIMIASMGFKAATMMSQFAGLGPAIEIVGTKYMRRGFVQFVTRPAESYRLATALSGELRHRLDNRDRDLRDKLRLLEGREDFLAKVQDTALRGIAWADMMVSLPTWLGAYHQAVDGGADVDTAVKAGDRAVRLSQGAGGAKDLAAVMARSDTLMRLLTMFYTPFNALYNRLRDIGHDVGGVRDVPRAALRLWWVWLLPAVMGELLAGRPPDDDEEPDEWALKAIALYPSLAVPFVRDVVGGAFGDFGYQLSPVAQVGASVATTIKKAKGVAAGDEELDALAKSALKTTGYLVGLPTGQLQITGGYLFDLAAGDADPEDLGDFAHDFLYRRRD